MIENIEFTDIRWEFHCMLKHLKESRLYETLGYVLCLCFSFRLRSRDPKQLSWQRICLLKHQWQRCDSCSWSTGSWDGLWCHLLVSQVMNDLKTGMSLCTGWRLAIPLWRCKILYLIFQMLIWGKNSNYCKYGIQICAFCILWCDWQRRKFKPLSS
jgi:hypothetical protein